MQRQQNTPPLSPHIQIYRWTLTMALSILHRASGMALYAGAAGVALWLVAIAQGGTFYIYIQSLLLSDVGLVFLFLYLWALLHHMFGGVRHFIWDMGAGFDLRFVEWLARITALLPMLIVLGVWWLAIGHKMMG